MRQVAAALLALLLLLRGLFELLDPSRIQQDFGWEPKTPLEEGVRNAIDYYRERGISQTYTHLKVDELQPSSPKAD